VRQGAAIVCYMQDAQHGGHQGIAGQIFDLSLLDPVD
jgi:hypothetical protein